MNFSYRQQIAFVGMLAGALVGAMGALLWLDHLTEEGEGDRPGARLDYGDVARIATALIALLRQINEMTLEDRGEETT